jgi:hypothetical protein
MVLEIGGIAGRSPRGIKKAGPPELFAKTREFQ